VIEHDRVFAGAVWDVRRDRFSYGERELVREYVDHTGAVAVLALDEADRALLIRQYRHPIGQRDWELPAGLLDVDGESALLAAQRELAEEVELTASRWSLLCELFTSPGGSNEALRVYLARGLDPAAPFSRTDEEEFIQKRWAPLDEVVTAVLERRVANSILSIAVLAAHASRERGWTSLGDAEQPWHRRATTGDRSR
jgi:ADP-ribose pyrophosphatase